MIGGDLNLLHLTRRRRTPLVRQAEVTECGLACLAMVAAHHGHETDLATLRRKHAVSLRGVTLRSLLRIADMMGFDARPLRLELEHLGDLVLPAILHWNMNHFVVLTGIIGRGRDTRYVINDPAVGERHISAVEFSSSFTGIAVELAPSARFEVREDRTRLKFWQLWSGSIGLRTNLLQIVVLSVVYQVCVLAAPAYIQAAVDQALPAADQLLVVVLGSAFIGVAALGGAAAFMRGRLVNDLSQLLGYQLISNLVRHLLRLPLDWYEKRYIGDITSRFSSTQPISELLSRGMVSSAIDGLISITALVLILSYSAILGALTIAALTAYFGVRFVALPKYNRLQAEAVVAQAEETTSLVESLHGMASVKAYGQESERFRLWRAKRAKSTNAQIRAGRLRNSFEVFGQACLDVESVIFVMLSVTMAISGDLTIGGIFAVLAYKAHLISAVTRLAAVLVDYKVLEVHLDRLADIVYAQAEAVPDESTDSSNAVETIELRNIHFSYGVGEPEILRGVSLIVRSGETVALTGPSGSGKTTLAKVIIGLIAPTSGQVLVNDVPLSGKNMRSWRSKIGYVSQDDVLYTGSLADNIAFFDSDIDMSRVVSAAKAAVIHDDISAMPMRYSTLVGDMGSALSGGQRARVLLARALYRQPEILIADEGTAHLDVETEAAVNASLKSLGITKIIIAHRPETIRSCDRILNVFNGRVSEATPLVQEPRIESVI